MNYKKVLTILVLFGFFVMGCGGMATYPQTDVGKANYFDASVKALTEQYNDEARAAVNFEYIELLQKRRIAILNMGMPAKQISIAAANGQPVSMGMITSFNLALNQVKLYLISQQRAPADKIQIASLMELAGVHQFDLIGPKAPRAPWLVLIELISGVWTMYNQLVVQSAMTPEQIELEFRTVNHPWIMEFGETSLVMIAH